MKRFIPLVLILAVAGYFGFITWQRSINERNTELFYGTAEADEVLISTLVPGQVLELHAIEGRRVSAGDPLAVLDDRLLRAQLGQGQAMIQATGAQTSVVSASLDGVATEVERTRSLVQAGSASRMQLDMLQAQQDTLQAQREAVRAQVRAAEAAVNVVETQLGYTRIDAPLDGTVLRVHARRGETLFAGSTLLVMADLSVMKVNVYVPEPMLGKVRLGQAVQVFNDSFPDRPLSGAVARIADSAEFTPKNVQTRDERVRLVYKVEVSVPNPEGVLKIGMPVDVRFVQE